MAAQGRDFYALPLRLTQGLTYTHHIFIKPHNSAGGHGSAAAIQQGCGLFVTGLPFTHQDLREVMQQLFSSFGPVKDVAMHATKTSAIVVFAEASSCRKVLAAAQGASLVQLQLQPPEQPFGLKAWVEEHKACFPGNGALSQQLDSWMEEFEAEEALRKANTAAALTEDGWTVVKRRGGGKKVSDGAGAAVGAVAPAAARAIAAGKKAQTVVDFYRFQQRNKRRDELMELRQKFAEDKRRIAEMKATRKFK